MNSFTLTEAKCLAKEYDKLRFNEFEKYTVQLIIPKKNESNNLYFVNVIVTTKDGDMGSKEFELESFCKDNNIEFDTQNCL